MTSQDHRADPGEMRAVAGAVSAEALQLLLLQQRLETLRAPEFGPTGARMRDNSHALRNRLSGTLESALKRLQALSMRTRAAAAGDERGAP